jgi:hypothetical protein
MSVVLGSLDIMSILLDKSHLNINSEKKPFFLSFNKFKFWNIQLKGSCLIFFKELKKCLLSTNLRPSQLYLAKTKQKQNFYKCKKKYEIFT